MGSSLEMGGARRPFRQRFISQPAITPAPAAVLFQHHHGPS
jgi:hypothetical protein